MNKIVISLLILILTLTILNLSGTKITVLESNKKFLNISSFTKAVCKDNFCQDYLFNCKDNQITSINPITGAAIQFNKQWQDPRTIQQINKSC
jgi:hypothetical protein